MVSSVTGAADRTVVYTDGACRGNPGPGGWGWVVPDGPWANGFDPDTTNQRMELMAVLDAMRTIEGGRSRLRLDLCRQLLPRRLVEGLAEAGLEELEEGTGRQPRHLGAAHRPLPLTRGEITFTWVKGHAGDEYNDIADRLAVEASHTVGDAMASAPPTISDPLTRSTQADPFVAATAGPDGVYSSAWVPTGPAILITGVQPPQLGGYDPNPIADDVRRQLTEILVAKAELHPDLVVVTGLRLGAETLAAEAAAEAELPFVAVLPFPDPEIKWPAATQRRFHELLAEASAIVRLEKRCRPTTGRPARRWTVATAGCARPPRKRSSCGTTTSRGSARSCRRSNRCCPTMSGSSALEHALQRRLRSGSVNS